MKVGTKNKVFVGVNSTVSETTSCFPIILKLNKPLVTQGGSHPKRPLLQICFLQKAASAAA